MTGSPLTQVCNFVDSILTPAGFRRKKTTYNRSLSGGIVDLLHLQEGVQHANQVAVNIGVHFRRSAEMLGEDSPPWIDLSHCHVRSRLNAISECDEWINLEDAENANGSLRPSIRQFAFAFWEQLSSVDAVLRHWKNQTFPPTDIVNTSAIAALMVDCGDFVGAKKLLWEMRQWRLANKLNPKIIDEDAEKLGIVLT